MRFSLSAALLAVAGLAGAQRPSNESICDYYTTALLKQNTPANQYKLLTLLVNTAVIGNYTMPNVGVAVTGIVNPGMYNGTAVNLLPYFDGGLKSSNRGMPVAVNFLDDGGAAPLKNNMPANGQSSNQYKLLTHLYQYFGALLMCSGYSEMGFPAYAGQGSQYKVHQYMDLNPYQVGYFIEQVGLAASSFGVTSDDVTAVGMALTSTFDYRCAPAATVIPAQGAQLQSICSDSTCPLSPNATCSAYPDGGAAMQPMVANATLAMGEGTNSTSSSGSGTSTGSPTSSTPASFTGGAAANKAGWGLAVVGAIAAAVAL